MLHALHVIHAWMNNPGIDRNAGLAVLALGMAGVVTGARMERHRREREQRERDGDDPPAVSSRCVLVLA